MGYGHYHYTTPSYLINYNYLYKINMIAVIDLVTYLRAASIAMQHCPDKTVHNITFKVEMILLNLTCVLI